MHDIYQKTSEDLIRKGNLYQTIDQTKYMIHEKDHLITIYKKVMGTSYGNSVHNVHISPCGMGIPILRPLPLLPRLLNVHQHACQHNKLQGFHALYC